MGIDRTVQNTVGNTVYGTYYAIFNFTLIFQVLLDFGLQSYNNQTVSKAPQAMRNLFPNIVVAKLILSVIYLAIVFILGLIWGFVQQDFILLSILALLQIASSFLLFFRSNISALQRFKTDSIFSVLDRFIVIAIVSLLLFLPQIKAHFKIEYFALAQLLAFSIALIAAFKVCTRLNTIHWHHIHLRKVRLVLKRSIPYALLVFLMGIYMRSDVVLLDKLAEEGVAGKYAAAFRLLDVSNNMSGVLLAGLLLPLFGKMIAQKEAFQSILRLSVNLLLPASWGLVLITLFWGEQIFTGLYKEVTTQDTPILQWLMLCLPMYAINYIYSTLLTANGSIKILVRISLVAVVLNVGLNLYGIYTSGADAAIFTARNAFITLLFTSICNIWFGRKIMQLRFDPKWIARLLAFAGLSFAAAYGITQVASGWSMWLQITATAGLSLMIYLLCGIISFKELQTPLKRFSSPHN